MEDVDDGQAEPLPYNPNNPAEVRAYYEKRRKRQLYTMLAVVWIMGLGGIGIYYMRGAFSKSQFPYITIFAVALIFIVSGYVIWGLRRVANGTYVPGALGWGRKSGPGPQPAIGQPYQPQPQYNQAPPAPMRFGEGEYDGPGHPSPRTQVVVVQIGPDGRPMGPPPAQLASPSGRSVQPHPSGGPPGRNMHTPHQSGSPSGSPPGNKYPAPIPVQPGGPRQIIL